MANRSTFNSVLPREDKRIIDLIKGDSQYVNTVRKLFLEAHSMHLSYVRKRLSQKTNVDSETENTESV